MRKLLDQEIAKGVIRRLTDPTESDKPEYEIELAALRHQLEELWATVRATAPPSVLVSLNEVCRMTSLSRTAVNARRRDCTFPQAVSLGGPKRVAFVRAEVEAWIRDRIASRARAGNEAHTLPPAA